jgi:nitrogen regulatory protein PII
MDKLMEDMTISKARMLTLILSENQSHKCIRLAKAKGIRGGMVTIGKGTVKSAILNLLGIKSQKKEIIHFLLKKEQAEELLDYLDDELQLKKPGHGIAYTTSVMDAIGLLDQKTCKKQIIRNTEQGTEGESMFKKLTVIVDLGMADDVMDIAREAGVRGGTILHGRGAGAEIATKLFGVEIEPEKELVIILTPDNLIDKVVNALFHGLNLDEPGKGILFVEPILETRGLFEMSNENRKDT